MNKPDFNCFGIGLVFYIYASNVTLMNRFLLAHLFIFFKIKYLIVLVLMQYSLNNKVITKK